MDKGVWIRKDEGSGEVNVRSSSPIGRDCILTDEAASNHLICFWILLIVDVSCR